jgi:hypothetical protein
VSRGTEDLSHPFLSVVVPVGTAGTQALRESLLCLVGQDDVDFEALLVTQPGAVRALEEVVSDQPPRLSSRLRVVETDATHPGAVRNAGLAEARGRLVTVLPEGDLVLGSWVASFHDAEPSSDGRVLRALGVTQEHSVVQVAGHAAVRAEGSPRALGPGRFSLWQHALEPLSPPASWAWPRTLVHDHGLGYDPTVVDDPDWELLLRAAELIGVSDLEVVTSVHRTWRATGSSAGRLEGPAAQDLIDSRPLLLPPGEARRLRTGSSETAATQALAQELSRTAEELRLTHDHAANLEAVVRSLEGKVEAVQRRHDKEVARLRRKLESRRSAEPFDTGTPRDEAPPERSWRPRRRSRGPGD